MKAFLSPPPLNLGEPDRRSSRLQLCHWRGVQREGDSGSKHLQPGRQHVQLGWKHLKRGRRHLQCGLQHIQHGWKQTRSLWATVRCRGDRQRRARWDIQSDCVFIYPEWLFCCLPSGFEWEEDLAFEHCQASPEATAEPQGKLASPSNSSDVPKSASAALNRFMVSRFSITHVSDTTAVTGSYQSPAKMF